MSQKYEEPELKWKRALVLLFNRKSYLKWNEIIYLLDKMNKLLNGRNSELINQIESSQIMNVKNSYIHKSK